MKVFSKLWGLIIDDVRLAGTLILALILAFVFAKTHENVPAIVVIWGGLILSFIWSIMYQVRLAKRKG